MLPTYVMATHDLLLIHSKGFPLGGSKKTSIRGGLLIKLEY
jgi:hypothetical protein